MILCPNIPEAYWCEIWKAEVKPLLRSCSLLLFSRSVMSDFFATPWTVACQAPLSTGFPRQEYRIGLSFPFPRDLPDPEIEPTSPALQVDSVLLSHFLTKTHFRPQLRKREFSSRVGLKQQEFTGQNTGEEEATGERACKLNTKPCTHRANSTRLD